MILSALSIEVILAIIPLVIGGCGFLLGTTWKISHKDARLEARLITLENNDSEIFNNMLKEIERRVEKLENDLKHEDELLRILINANHEKALANHEKALSEIKNLTIRHVNNKKRIAILVEENKEIKEHVVGLQAGLNRNGVAVRVEEAWLNHAITDTLLDNASDFG